MEQFRSAGTSLAQFIASLSIDVFLFIGLLVVTGAFIIRYGKRRSVSALLGTLIAVLLFPIAPGLPTGTAALDFIGFGALAVALYTVLRPLTQASFSERRFMKTLEIIILTASAFTLALTAYFHVGALHQIHDFNALIDTALNAPHAYFIGITVSLFGIAIVTRPKLFQ
jgi:hypothetical protein